MTRVQLNTLELVYRPISNQEAEWVKDDNEVLELLKQSKLYMIGRRAEAFLRNVAGSAETNVITFDFEVDGIGSDPGEYHAASTSTYVVPDRMELDAGEKHIRVWNVDEGGERRGVFDWFNTEALLQRRTRHPALRKLDRHREFAKYELLYSGISTGADAFTRFVVNPHEKRVQILSNEYPLRPGARVTDEIYLFFFRVVPLHIQVLDDDDFDCVGVKPNAMSDALVVADAEKAYTRILKSRYNRITFKNYPKGIDGLYGAGLGRYGYAINEDISFWTEHGTIRGAYDPHLPVSNEADFIFVEGDEVSLVTPAEMRGGRQER